MNEVPSDLSNFLPGEGLDVEVKIREELAPVVERISKIIPPDLLWDIFSSTPNETRGRIVFPYSRIDSAVIVARSVVILLDDYKDQCTPKEFKEWYERGCIQAFEALLWVEVGFEGLENLARSSASENWTSAVGHFVNDEERVQGIMTAGKEMFDDCLRRFVEFRNRKKITDDYFTRYGVEHLLDRFN